MTKRHLLVATLIALAFAIVPLTRDTESAFGLGTVNGVLRGRRLWPPDATSIACVPTCTYRTSCPAVTTNRRLEHTERCIASLGDLVVRRGFGRRVRFR